MKKVNLTLIFSLITINLIFGQKCECFDFEWQGATISGRYIPNAVITVPLSIDDLPYDFNMQLDLGAVTSVFYGNSIEPYLQLHPELRNKIDSTKTFNIQSQKNVKLSNIKLKMGDIDFKDREIGLFSEFGDSLTVDSVKTNSSKHIGTIAADLFQDKIVIIDYPKSQICIADKVPRKYRGIKYQDFVLEQGRIKVPLEIMGNTEMLMFDTGSSMFSLITTKLNAEKISDKVIVDSLLITSWGEEYTVYGLNVVSDVSFGNETLPPALVYYFKEPIYDEFFEQENMWGITGNSYFSKNKLVIDYRNKKIGMK